jgi:hypothetical protein
MDIKSLNEYLRPKPGESLVDLFRPVILRPIVKNENGFLRHEVTREEEMRIDLVFQNIYELEPNTVGLYLEHIDVLLAINNIDNPLNIRIGTVIYYPYELGKLNDFRINSSQSSDIVKTGIAKKLSVPNKSTRKDKSRSSYVQNGYSLPPVVQETPKPPVKIENGRFSIGGL